MVTCCAENFRNSHLTKHDTFGVCFQKGANSKYPYLSWRNISIYNISLQFLLTKVTLAHDIMMNLNVAIQQGQVTVGKAQGRGRMLRNCVNNLLVASEHISYG